MVEHLPAMRETQVQLLGQEDPLEKEMATHSSTLAWKIPWTEEPGRLWSMGSQRVGLHFPFLMLIRHSQFTELGTLGPASLQGNLLTDLIMNVAP